ncbi:hypothetical protein ACFE04_022350 [Oxalis oulophora]
MTHYTSFLRLFLRRQPPSTSAARVTANFSTVSSQAQPNHQNNNEQKGESSKWFTLPPFNRVVNGPELGRRLAQGGSSGSAADEETTAIKWVLKCCPELPRNLVQKLFRLRQVFDFSLSSITANFLSDSINIRYAEWLKVETLLMVRRRPADVQSSDVGGQEVESRVKRVSAKDSLSMGDQIFLPITVHQQSSHSEKKPSRCNKEEEKFIHSLVLYKDRDIIVINKPPGMPVQGGVGIKRSFDELANLYLNYDYPEQPRLVHRLDRDCSGILVLGRTQMSATVLHSIFREKTIGASKDENNSDKRVLQRKYWALVIGSPRRQNGLISTPLGKVVMDNGKSERITVVDNTETMSSQHAITEYRVICPSSHGFTWLELSPLTGRKHQLRVHCAEVLGTPIVGDYKYGWQAHKRWTQYPSVADSDNSNEKRNEHKKLPLGIDLESGNICDKEPRLHLHSKQITLPNVSQAMQAVKRSPNCDLSELESIDLTAPLPVFMQTSWDTLLS